MDEASVDRLFNMFAERWQQAIEERRYDDAVTLAIAAHLAFREVKAVELENIGLSWLVATHARMTGKETGPGTDLFCSFCTQRKDEDSIIVGVSGQICTDCVRRIHDQLKPT